MPSNQNKNDLKQKILKDEPTEGFIVERIFKAVMEQRLAPNTKLSEARLCETFGVGRMRVRRALLLLSSQGIIQLHSNRGAYVSCPDSTEAKDVFSARMLIEPPLVRQLARNANQINFVELTHHIILEDSARAKNDRTEIIKLSGEFHIMLARASGNKFIIRMIRELVTKTSLIVGLFGSSQKASCPDEEHADILQAIKSSDAEAAEMLLFSHLKHIQDALDMGRTLEVHDDLATILQVG